MSDYVRAKDGLEALHTSYVEAEEERDQLRGLVRRLGYEATGTDPQLACQNIMRIVNSVREEGEW